MNKHLSKSVSGNEITGATKKRNAHKKLTIIISSLMLIIFTIITILTITYHSRPLSKYIESNSDNLIKIEIVEYDDKTTRIDENETQDFLNKLLIIKVRPCYIFTPKVVSSYTIKLYYNDALYEINNYYIYNEENSKNFKPINDDLYNLVCKYID